ncbi:MAG: thioredoxin family protein [Paramuribaculum sp.]|nr:thioredoxin family protein [Paramuribaculum sp.]MDE6304042.1 thioredoxin family protein [Paramuribaculum sp.]
MKKIFIPSLVALAMMAMSACNSSQKQEENNVAEEAAVEEVAPVAEGVIELTTDTVDMAAYGGLPVFIDFNATWCGPCKAYGPTYHAVAEKYAGKATFLSVDVDKNPSVAKKYVGDYIPQTTAIAANGSVVSKVGMLSEEELTALVDSVLSL